MRYTSRPITFALTLSLGTAVWYTLAYRSVAGDVAPVQSNVAITRQTSMPTPQPQPTPDKLIRFGPIEQLSGFTNTDIVMLRHEPDASARVFARVELPANNFVDILEATRDFIHVKFPAPAGSKYADEGKAEYEGWAAWGNVVPSMSALVLDAQTGAVVSRVPLGLAHTFVTYSPDGSRALFYRTEEYGGAVLGYEVNTSDYKLTRTLVPSDSLLLGSVFYSPVDGALTAFGRASVDDKRDLSLMRLGDFYTIDVPTKISAAAATASVIAPDGRTGFIIHSQDSERGETTIDVVDLQSSEIRNTISLGSLTVYWRVGFVVSRDGSELYLNRPESDSVSVIDTWTGQTVREFPKKFTKNDGLYFNQSDLVGDSLFVKYWTQTGDDGDMHSRPHTAWLSATRPLTADREIESVIEAGGSVFAINAEATRLFRLDKKHHIQNRLPIERPELQQRKEARDDLTTYGLAASPDGKHIIVFVGIYQGC